MQYDSRVVDSVATAYYTRVVAEADHARSRAQAGFAIASSLAGGLAGLGLLTALAPVPWPVRVLGLAALACWLVVAALFARAVAQPVVLATGPQPDADAFVDKVLRNAAEERDQLDARRRLAQSAGYGAAATTTLTLALALLVPRSGPEPASIVLTERGAAAVALLCGQAPDVLLGELDVAETERQLVPIRVTESACRRGDTVYISRADILQVATAG